MCCAHAHKISLQLKISRRCIRQTIRKFDKYRIVATRPGAGRTRKSTNRQTRFIKLEQIRDETNSLTDLVRYVNTNMSLSISTSTISRIFQQYNMASYQRCPWRCCHGSGAVAAGFFQKSIVAWWSEMQPVLATGQFDPVLSRIPYRPV